jgi:hypothetical protein
MREASGKILSGTLRGVVCATETRTPATVRRITVGIRKRVAALTRGPARARTSSPRSIRHPAGSSMRPTSAVRRGFGVGGNDEYEHEEGRGQRREQRRLAGKGNLAALDRVMEPLFRRLLCFVFRVDVAAHRSPRGPVGGFRAYPQT